MDRIKTWFRREEEEYAPLTEASEDDTDAPPSAVSPDSTFSWLEYSIFVLLGMSMLWAYNMFLAAGPYLSQRFAASPWIATNFQAAQLFVSNLAALVAMLTLTYLQRGASYARRIFAGLAINTTVFTLLAISTKVATGVSSEAYFGFVLATVVFWSTSTALFQNGIFAYVGGFGQPRYTQGIMVGQGLAGVLPCIAQVGLTLSLSSAELPEPEDGEGPVAPPPVSSSAAMAYFLTAVAISVVTFFAFSYLVRRQAKEKLKAAVHAETDPAGRRSKSKAVPISVLLRKLRWPAGILFITFVITIQFPVFTQMIVSVVPIEKALRIQQPACFIPIAFLFWNTGDLLGRMASAFPKHVLRRWPQAILVAAVARIIFIAAYYLCNIGGKGAVISSDLFYLLVVQFFYGISNGYIGSICMMGAGDWVEPEEREATGGFMGLCIVLGLTVGSILSFFATGG